MKGLIIGGGSIGQRHLKNLKELGLYDLGLVEPVCQRRSQICEDHALIGFENLREGLLWQPDFAVIASPTHLHARQAVKVAERNCHLFIEKPLSHTENYLDELLSLVEKNGLVSLVGCNMRFHPGPAKVKALLEQETVGQVIFARVHTGSYLPEWRPWQDYRQSYSANARMGGGCLLDCIHEIDLARWYLGEAEEVFCYAAHLSSLEVDVEDVATIVSKHKGGTVCEIHLDYVQRTYERGCQIVGESGSIFWDFNEQKVRWYDANTDTWQIFAPPEGWHMNSMYIDEMKHFLECIRKGRRTTLPVSEAIAVMNVVFAAKASIETSCFAPVR